MSKTVNSQICVRRDTVTNWSTNNPILASGEIGLDTTNNKFKFGDGSTVWNSLGYVTDAYLPLTGGTMNVNDNSTDFIVNSTQAQHSFPVRFMLNDPILVGDQTTSNYTGYLTGRAATPGARWAGFYVNKDGTTKFVQQKGNGINDRKDASAIILGDTELSYQILVNNTMTNKWTILPTTSTIIDNTSGTPYTYTFPRVTGTVALMSMLSTVATTGSYNDLSNTPAINNTTITIQKNGVSVGDFSTNQSTAESINITISKSDVGLSNVDNTSDVNKPISTATQTALNLKANSADLATVATTGAYSDLSGTPSTLPNPNALTVGSKSYTGSSAVSVTLSDLGGATIALYTASLSASATWSGSGPYTTSISVSGILSTDIPIADIDLSSVSYSDLESVQEAWGKIYRITTSSNAITIYSTEALTTALTITLKVVR